MSPRRSSPAGALTLAVVLFGSAAVGFLFHQLTKSHETALRPIPAVAPPPAATTGAPPPRPVPQELPDISLPDTEGRPHRLAEWTGQPLLVNFWATWCEPCRREIPLLETIYQQKTGKRLQIVGIAIDNLDSVRKFVRDTHVDYPILVGEQGGLEAAAAFGNEPVLPFTAFADSQGDIVAMKLGELHQDEATFILARVADVDAGQLSLAAARAQIPETIRRLALSRASAAAN